MSHHDCAIVWLRRDLRLDDHPALVHACRQHQTVIPVYIHTENHGSSWSPGAASRVWLDAVLRRFAQTLDEHGSKLIIRQGAPEIVLPALIAETGASAVYWHRLYEPAAIEQDALITRQLNRQGITAQPFGACLLCEPAQLRTKQGSAYRVFTPFWQALQQQTILPPLPPPTHIPAPAQWPSSLTVAELGLCPAQPWAQQIMEQWETGEDSAQRALATFCAQHMTNYAEARDLPGQNGTSRLSPALHYGELSVRRVWQSVAEHSGGQPLQQPGATAFLRELGWREFAHHILVHYPHTTDQPMQPRFRRYPWAVDWQPAFDAWRRGQTGYPLVDAAMRQLWHSGWIHNRARMVASSFLVKNLRVPWQVGARWFWDTLLDADLANNSLGWQWVAGCGVDAAPYFRVFNPLVQGKQYDADGSYVRRWLPELAGTPARQIHQPWRPPIVDLGQSRQAALDGWRRINGEDDQIMPSGSGLG